ncbi:FAD-binding domain-containing protein [Crucibulum laeve]|uniref:FAD-binding domain-containing protein n=1 Tax=Crucibulum laeve TaxID=68775 RepID=A0A5C3LI82_9AGAR|nr:FAD-binding domain-containing protein [Crucibulum laeve]
MFSFSLLFLAFASIRISRAKLPTASTQASVAACAEISSTLGSVIVQSLGVEYTLAASGAWDLFNAQSQPTCIVFPRNSGHVQAAMTSIFKFNSSYAVQAGGHSAMEGWNTVQNGVLIHFSHMTDVSYNPSTDTITLQPGVHWGNVYNVLEPQGVAPVGGRQGDVGTGLLLGGGLSFLSPAYGFASDSYKALHVVLVTGQLVTATATNQYADLFRALKGGGNRFGIVTRYEFGNASSEAVLNATSHYVRDVQDPKAVLLVSFVHLIVAGLITPITMVNLYYNGTTFPTGIFDEFLAIPGATGLLTPLSYLDIATSLPPGNDRGSIQLFGASAFSVSEPVSVYQNAFARFTNYSNVFRNELSLNVLAFTPVLNPQIQAGRLRDGTIIDPPLGGYAAVQLSRTLVAGMSSISPGLDVGTQLLLQQVPPSPGIPLFLNECDKKQNVFQTYGAYSELKQTYNKYDPTRFNVHHTDGPIGL